VTAVDSFAYLHEESLLPAQARYYRDLLPLERPGPGQQYGFEVDLDASTGSQACVVACPTLNGLDEGEAWRSVGLLHGGPPTAPFQQTVTTACHHCVEPACLAGCPVDAYEKDPVTGIVAHLDDQCIGCGYCTFTCPYEVPRFNPSRGIVRKCDMCRGRLDAGEAPACVQSCPNGAIRISLVEVASVPGVGALVPGAPPSSLTRPTTVYRTARDIPDDAVAADRFSLRPAHAHPPLAAMLVLTQLAVGAYLFRPWTAVVASVLALGVSVLHLGRPLKAYRAVIGVRHSWLSREIVAFGAFAALAPLRTPVAAAVGLFAVYCSIRIYSVTRRTWWRFRTTASKFALTTLVCGLAVGGRWPAATALALALKLAFEASVFLHLRDGDDTDLRRTARLLTGDLLRPTAWRFALGGLGVAAAFAWTPLAVAVIVGGELLERTLFFRASSSPRMPGILP
jgi:formate dehydrogenase iron-sulfur subunit